MVLEPQQLLDMYRQMAMIRHFDQRAVAEFHAGNLPGAVHAYSGQEAVAVGVCAALRRDDKIASTHRGHGHTIAKGADIKLMMAELFGRSNGYCHGKGGSMHIADFSVGMLGANGIVGAGMPIATGAALAAQLDGDCYFQDGIRSPRGSGSTRERRIETKLSKVFATYWPDHCGGVPCLLMDAMLDAKRAVAPLHQSPDFSGASWSARDYTGFFRHLHESQARVAYPGNRTGYVCDVSVNAGKPLRRLAVKAPVS
jgi:hypothetical protein